MLIRRSVLLALAGVLAAAGCKDVDQDDPAPVLALATFNPDTGTIPLPNDLALQAAPGLPDGDTRDDLFTLIGLGGWPPDVTLWSPIPGIAVFIRTETFDPESGAYAPSAPPADLDDATINASTIAIVRLNEPATVVPPALFAYDPMAGVLILRPALPSCPSPTECIIPPGRYVVAVRGGANGVKTADGLPLLPDRAITLVALGTDLRPRENRPPGLTDEQAEDLNTLLGTFAVGMDWNRMNTGVPAQDVAICETALGFPAGGFPDDLSTCWLPPIPNPPLNQPLPTPGVTSAFAGVDLVFPHAEIASIQTFEVFAPSEGLQEEVTP